MIGYSKIKSLAFITLPFLWSGLLAFFIFKLGARQVPADLLRPWLSLFFLSAGLALLLASSFKAARRAGAALTLLLSIGAACTACLYMYYRRLKARLGTDDIYGILQSDFSESILFALSEFVRPKSILLSVGMFLLGLAVILISARILAGRGEHGGMFPALTKPGRSLLSAGFLLLGGGLLMTQIQPIKLAYTSVRQYHEDMAEFERLVSQFDSVPFAASKNERGELYVLVIGESASRDFIHAYGGPYANSPWLDSLRASSGGAGEAVESAWVVFNNAYSIHTHTVPVMQAALTDGRLLTGLTFPRGKNLLQVSRAAGVRSVWLSNQARVGVWDSPVSALAHLADDTEFTGAIHSKNLAGSPPDEVLLPLLDERLNRMNFAANNLLVLHLMGSHAPYESRYPVDYAAPDSLPHGLIGSLADQPEKMRQYINYVTSLAYTEQLLRQVVARLEQYADKPVFMLYFADHGEDVFSKSGAHDFKTFTWSMSRVPMLLWMSDGYRERYPDKAALLQGRADSLFSNDLVYDLYLGLSGISVDGYDPRFDLSHPAYSLTLADAVITGHAIASDPWFKLRSNTAREGNKALAAHRVNTVFKFRQAWAAGIRNFEVDLVFKNEQGRAALWLGHDDKSMAGIDFAEYLAQIGPEAEADMQFFWLDI